MDQLRKQQKNLRIKLPIWESFFFYQGFLSPATCIYQAATRSDLPPYGITIWLIDDVMLIFVCWLVNLIQGFCYSYLTLEIGGLELTSIIISITIEPTSQVC